MSKLGLDQDDLEGAAIIFDQIRDLYRDKNFDLDEQLADQFESHIKNTIHQLDTFLSNQTRKQCDIEDLQKILQAKVNLYEICLYKFSQYLENIDPKLSVIFQEIINFKKKIILEQEQLLTQEKFEQKKYQNIYQQEIEHVKQELEQYKKENQQQVIFLQSLSKNNQKISSFRKINLKELKTTIQEIYSSKQKYDSLQQENKLPQETVEKHMYTYFQKKYGAKNLIIEQAGSILVSIKDYQDDIDVKIFDKILNHECDDDIRFVINQMRINLQDILKMHIQTQYNINNENELQKIFQEKMLSDIHVEECYQIIRYIYDQNDQEILIQLIDQTQKNQNLNYEGLETLILEFTFANHQNFISNLLKIFKQIDTDEDGILDQNQFNELLGLLPINTNDELLSILDNFNNNKVTFSKCVSFFSQFIPDGQQYNLLYIISQMNIQ